MDTVIEFLLNNYLWFLVISLILIFALIGYLVDSMNKEAKKAKIKPIAKVEEDEKIEIHPSIEEYTNDEFDEPLISDK